MPVYGEDIVITTYDARVAVAVPVPDGVNPQEPTGFQFEMDRVSPTSCFPAQVVEIVTAY